MSHYTELFKYKEHIPVKTGMLYKKNGESIYLESIFADEGITGTKKKYRKAFEYMMQCAENREFDIVYVKNVQRFSRNAAYGMDCLKRLKQLGIKVFFEEGGLDSSNPSHEFVINTMLSLSQAESQSKSTACKFGIRKAQESGKWTSNCPYGYNRVKGTGYLQVNDDEAQVIKTIYDLYLNKGYGHKKIVDYLLENEIPTKKGGTWYTQHVKHILTNPLYTGLQTTHKTENMDVNVTLIKDIPEHKWIRTERTDLQIVPLEDWQKAQDMASKKLDMMRNSRNRPSSKNLFSTIIFCGNCGGILRRKQKRTKVDQKMVYLDEYEWVCQNNDLRGTKACKYRNAIDEKILMELVKYEVSNYQNIDEVREFMLQKYIDKNFVFDEVEAKRINDEYSDLKKEFSNYIRLNTKGIITDEELEEHNQQYRKQMAELEKEKLKIDNIASEIEKTKRAYKDFMKFIKSIEFDNLSNADLKKIFNKIVIKTDSSMLDADGNLNKYYKVLEPYPFKWINKDKGICKIITAEPMFMDTAQSELYFPKSID
jgi:DNA invertase Pin-like site-specific DNA recombinase